jgi:hypothetical protein
MLTHRASLFDRYQELAALWQASPQYVDPAFLERYARRHAAELLKSRTTIIQEYAAFRADTVFVAYLETCAPQLLAWARWRVAALAIAEGLMVGTAKPTPDEVRRRMLNRARVRALDRMAKILQRLKLTRQLREDLTSMDIDEDEAERLEHEFASELFDDEQPGEGFKQV